MEPNGVAMLRFVNIFIPSFGANSYMRLVALDSLRSQKRIYKIHYNNRFHWDRDKMDKASLRALNILYIYIYRFAMNHLMKFDTPALVNLRKLS